MTKRSLKKPKRKVVPICYRKRSHSTSNTSLSQLLSIGSYKKRINELGKNNRALAVALQDARCETAYQSDVIKNYARDHNKIMFARLKLQGMAKTITQLVTDLHEVVNCLDVNWASENNFLQKNGLPRDKLKMRAPEGDIIEEESAPSSETEDCVESGFSCADAASNEVLSDKAPNVEEGINEILPCTPENITGVADALDMPPILFVEDINDKPGEKLSREHKSSRKSFVKQISLTPELDPDICVMRKRSSSRRQVIIPSAPSSSRSRRRSSCHRSLSIENATPRKGLESTTQRKLSLVLLNHKESCENKSLDEAFFNTEECEEVSSSSDLELKECSEKDEFLGCTFVNMKDRGSKNKNSSSPDLQYTTEHAVDVNFPNVLHSEPVVLPTSDSLNNNNIESNNTILQCEDMELTEVIRSVQLSVSGNSSNPMGCPLSRPDYQLNKPGKKEKNNMGVEKIQSEDKLCNVTVLSKDLHLNVEEKSCEAAINGVKVSNNEETSQDTESFNKKPSESPPRRTSRNKKNIIYKVFLSSSESESDSTPVKPESNKKKPNKIHRSTVIFKPKQSKGISDKKDKNGGADKSPSKDLQENNDTENLLSVYDLDVSNSKKPLKKSKPRSKPKNSSHNKETSKPLSQNCNITKLQGVNYKFTKNENLVNKEQKHQLLQNDSFISETNPAIHTDKTIKRNQSHFTFDSTELGTGVESEQTSTHAEELPSETTYLKNQELISRTPKSEIRRVSFASVDLVCNFNKMSVSKTIAGNKKTLRTSKSAVDLDDLKHLPSEAKDSVLFETNKSSDGTLETLHNPNTLFNFSEETELYSFVLPVTEVDKFSSSETTASLPPIVCDSSSDQNSKSSTKQKVGKLSLKRSKNCQKKPELDTYDKIDKDVLFREHHTQPSTLSKYKSSHKDLSYDSLNKNPEHTNSQTLEFPHEDAQIKTKTSKQLHVTPVEDNMLIPTDDIRPTGKSHEKVSSSLKYTSLLPNKNLEHTNSHTLEFPHKDVQIKTKTSKQLHATPAEDNMLIPTDDVKAKVKSRKKVSSSLKHKSPLPSADETSKKSSINSKLLESSPVLKDVLNLEENPRESLKRRSKVVKNYREPNLHKKLRRN